MEAPETSVAPDDYDKAVKQLVFEVRGKVSKREPLLVCLDCTDVKLFKR